MAPYAALLPAALPLPPPPAGPAPREGWRARVSWVVFASAGPAARAWCVPRRPRAPVVREGGTRRVQLVREGGTRRVQLVWKGGGGGGAPALSGRRHGRLLQSLGAAHAGPPAPPDEVVEVVCAEGGGGAGAGAGAQRSTEAGVGVVRVEADCADTAGAANAALRAVPPPHPPRTNRTRRVPHPVLIGHAAAVRRPGAPAAHPGGARGSAARG